MGSFTKGSYDTYKYTKVCGGGSCKSNASIEGNLIISDYGAIISLNMGNLNIEVSSLATREKEKVVL
jgi:hypothetical protein